MLAGLDAFNPTFLLDLNLTEAKITQANQQISSGIRVNVASDDPTAVAPILTYQNQAAQIQQVQDNLTLSNTESSAADNALASATTLLNQLTSIAAEGGSSTTTPAANAALSQQVLGIAQQLVSIANTSVDGQYIFGGDDPTTEPYTFDWSVSGGATQNNMAGNTATLSDVNGATTIPRMTAQQIFDATNSDGTPAAGNVFQAVYALGQALANNDQAGVQAASDSLKAAASQISQASSFYSNVDNWIQNASSTANSALTNVQTEVSNLRDVDVAAAATQLTTDQTALQAALQAHGSLDVKSLFDYMA